MNNKKIGQLEMALFSDNLTIFLIYYEYYLNKVIIGKNISFFGNTTKK